MPTTVRLKESLLARVQAYRKALGITEGEAIRQLVSAGLDAVQGGAVGFSGPQDAASEMRLQLSDLTDELAAMAGNTSVMSEEVNDLFKIVVETMIGVRMLVAKASPDAYAELGKNRDRYLQVRSDERRAANAPVKSREKV